MSENERGTKRVGRREVLQLFGVGLGATSALLTLRPVPAFAGPALSCKGRVELDEAGVALRRSAQYKEKCTDPKKACVVCVDYTAGTFGECGGCKILPGAVHPDGTCLGFAPMKEDLLRARQASSK